MEGLIFGILRYLLNQPLRDTNTHLVSSGRIVVISSAGKSLCSSFIGSGLPKVLSLSPPSISSRLSALSSSDSLSCLSKKITKTYHFKS